MEDIEIAEKYKMIGRNVAMYRKRKGFSQLELSLSLGHKSVSIVASAERTRDFTKVNILISNIC